MRSLRILCIILSFLLLLTLPACGDHNPADGTGAQTDPLDDNNYKVFLISSSAGNQYLADMINIKDLYPSETPLEPAEKVRTLKINGSDCEVKYTKSIGSGSQVDYYEYKSADNQVVCLYRPVDMALDKLTVNMDLAIFSGMDQEQYERWIQTFVSQFAQEDWSKIELNCVTNYTDTTSEKPVQQAVDGFVKEFGDGKAVTSWEFEYRKYISSVITNDLLALTFTPDEENGLMKVAARFNRNEFGGVDSIDLHEPTIETVINECLRDHAAENTVLKSWEAEGSDKLIMVGENIMLSRKIVVEFTWKGVGKSATYELAIDIPDP